RFRGRRPADTPVRYRYPGCFEKTPGLVPGLPGVGLGRGWSRRGDVPMAVPARIRAGGFAGPHPGVAERGAEGRTVAFAATRREPRHTVVGAHFICTTKVYGYCRANGRLHA